MSMETYTATPIWVRLMASAASERDQLRLASRPVYAKKGHAHDHPMSQMVTTWWMMSW